MKVQFIDFSLQPRPECTFLNADELIMFLRQLQGEESLSGELVGDNGYKLTFGIDGQLAFAQYSSTDGDPPYLVANAVKPMAESHDFLVTNELTEIDGNNCLSFDEFEAIVRHFMETGQNSPINQWNDA